jgi:hypothetical protein
LPVATITKAVSLDELISVCSAEDFEGLLIAGVHEPDPLTWVSSLRSHCRERWLPTAILHSPDELTKSSIRLAGERFRHMRHVKATGVRLKHQILIDLAGRQVVVNGKRENFGPLEFRILLFLIRFDDVVFSRGELLHRTRSSGRAVDPQIVDVLIRRIRSKFEAAASSLTTVYGLGYRFLRHDDLYLDRLTGKPFGSWPSINVRPNSFQETNSSQSIDVTLTEF